MQRRENYSHVIISAVCPKKIREKEDQFHSTHNSLQTCILLKSNFLKLRKKGNVQNILSKSSVKTDLSPGCVGNLFVIKTKDRLQKQ